MKNILFIVCVIVTHPLSAMEQKATPQNLVASHDVVPSLQELAARQILTHDEKTDIGPRDYLANPEAIKYLESVVHVFQKNNVMNHPLVITVREVENLQTPITHINSIRPLQVVSGRAVGSNCGTSKICEYKSQQQIPIVNGVRIDCVTFWLQQDELASTIPLISMALDHDEADRAITVSLRGDVEVWMLNKVKGGRRLIKLPRRAGCFFKTAQFCDEKNIIVTTSGDGTINQWLIEYKDSTLSVAQQLLLVAIRHVKEKSEKIELTAREQDIFDALVETYPSLKNDLKDYVDQYPDWCLKDVAALYEGA